MATKAAQKRLTKEYVGMQKEPPPFVWAAPDERNILIWNFLIHGPPDSPFAGGEYHGLLLFPSEYPFKPPGIKMLTPSGRFHPDKKYVSQCRISIQELGILRGALLLY